MVTTKLAFVVSAMLSAYLAMVSGAQFVEHVSTPVEDGRR